MHRATKKKNQKKKRLAAAKQHQTPQGYPRLPIVKYGDTDSIMCDFGPVTLEHAFEIGNDVAEKCNSMFKDTVKLYDTLQSTSGPLSVLDGPSPMVGQEEKCVASHGQTPCIDQETGRRRTIQTTHSCKSIMSLKNTTSSLDIISAGQTKEKVNIVSSTHDYNPIDHGKMTPWEQNETCGDVWGTYTLLHAPLAPCIRGTKFYCVPQWTLRENMQRTAIEQEIVNNEHDKAQIEQDKARLEHVRAKHVAMENGPHIVITGALSPGYEIPEEFDDKKTILWSDLSPQELTELTDVMRPKKKKLWAACVGRSSIAGFLNKEESLRQVCEADTRVLEEAKITRYQVADAMETMVEYVKMNNYHNIYHTRKQKNENGISRKFIVSFAAFMGDQWCPFGCNVRGNYDVTVTNRKTNQSFTYGSLLPHLIRCHGFFEGHTKYRVDPMVAIQVLELEPGKDYAPRFKCEYYWHNESDMWYLQGMPTRNCHFLVDADMHIIFNSKDETTHMTLYDYKEGTKKGRYLHICRLKSFPGWKILMAEGCEPIPIDGTHPHDQNNFYKLSRHKSLDPPLVWPSDTRGG